MQSTFDINQADIFTPEEFLGPSKAIEQSMEFFIEAIRKNSYLPKDAFKIDYLRKL